MRGRIWVLLGSRNRPVFQTWEHISVLGNGRILQAKGLYRLQPWNRPWSWHLPTGIHFTDKNLRGPPLVHKIHKQAALNPSGSQNLETYNFARDPFSLQNSVSRRLELKVTPVGSKNLETNSFEPLWFTKISSNFKLNVTTLDSQKSISSNFNKRWPPLLKKLISSSYKLKVTTLDPQKSISSCFNASCLACLDESVFSTILL